MSVLLSHTLAADCLLYWNLYEVVLSKTTCSKETHVGNRWTQFRAGSGTCHNCIHLRGTHPSVLLCIGFKPLHLALLPCQLSQLFSITLIEKGLGTRLSLHAVISVIVWLWCPFRRRCPQGGQVQGRGQTKGGGEEQGAREEEQWRRRSWGHRRLLCQEEEERQETSMYTPTHLHSSVHGLRRTCWGI